jgi:hypothetical protein
LREWQEHTQNAEQCAELIDIFGQSSAGLLHDTWWYHLGNIDSNAYNQYSRARSLGDASDEYDINGYDRDTLQLALLQRDNAL